MSYEVKVVADYGDMGKLYEVTTSDGDVFIISSYDGSDLDELVALAKAAQEGALPAN